MMAQKKCMTAIRLQADNDQFDFSVMKFTKLNEHCQ